MKTDKKIALLIKLLEKRYPCEMYDKAEKTDVYRLRVDKILSKLNKLEGSLENE